MKVIFGVPIPFIKQHETDMYISAIQNQFMIEKWDLSRIYKHENLNLSNCIEDCWKPSSIQEFDQALEELKKNEPIIFVTNIIIGDLKVVFPILKKHGIPIITINKEIMGDWFIKQGEFLQAWSLDSWKVKIKAMLMLHDMTRAIINYIRYKTVYYDYLLASANLYPEQTKHFIKIHHIKYDEFLQAQQSEPLLETPYILFLGTIIGDEASQKQYNAVDFRYYLRVLNQYFEMLEQKYQMPVVISEHPKTNYQTQDFQGRRIIKYRTPELIQHADYIVSHFCTSLANAVLLKKPIAILSSQTLLNSSNRESITGGIAIAEELGLEIVDLDHPKLTSFHLDEEKYHQFTERYLRSSDAVHQSNGQLICNALTEIFHTMV